MTSLLQRRSRRRRPRAHRVHKRIALVALWFCAGLFFCAADTPPQHHFVFAIDDPNCAQTLTETPSYADGEVTILRKPYAPDYRFLPAQDAQPDAASLQNLWEDAHAQWRAAAFEQALEISTPATDAVLYYRSFQVDSTLSALMQLRITLWLVLGDENAATREAIRLLSRGSVEYYCQDTDFPEACAHLTKVDAQTPYLWRASSQELRQLHTFTEQDDRSLALIEGDASQLVLVRIDGAGSTQHLERNDACAAPGFWENTLEAWDALLLAPPEFLAPPPPRPAIALERTLRIGMPIVAGIVGTMAIASTIHLHRRDQAFERCANTPDICPTFAQIQDAYTRWRRARTWTITSWSAAGVVAVAPIPLVLFKNRGLRRAQRLEATTGSDGQNQEVIR